MLFANRKTRYNITILISCFLLSYLSYFNIINSFFLADDFNWIYQIKTDGAFGIWTTAPAVFFRPIVSLTFFIDHTIWGLNSIGYHLTNLSFHAVCAFLVYQILSQLLIQAQLQGKIVKIISIIATLLFIILPSHVEAVTWISARSDLVAACFCLASFSCYLSYKINSNKHLFLGSYILFLLALLSKESVVIYPGIIFAYEVYHDLNHHKYSKKSIKNIVYFPLIYSTLFPIYLVMRYLGLGQLIGGYGTGVHLQFNSGIILRGLGSSLKVLIPPIPNSLESDWQLLFFILIIALLLLIIAYSWLGNFYQKISKILLFLITAFFISLLPVINLAFSIQDKQGERFLYFPSAFMVMIFALAVSTILWQNRLVLFIGVTAIILFFSHHLYTYNKNWQIASTISQQTIEDINSLAQTEGLFVINIPDHLNGAYIYRNGLYQAIQLFCEDQQIKYLPIVLLHNLIDPDDEVEMTVVGSNQYQVRLFQPEAHFYNVSISMEQRLETPNFKILDFDWTTRQSFTVEVKLPHFQDQVVYYSGGHFIRVASPI